MNVLTTTPSLTLNAETCWQAVMTRDAAYDGVFYFAVRTTGIYCRPSCKARQPRRENVSFHALPAAAEQAGFRACKRCQPRSVKLHDPQTDLVESICRLIETSVDEPPKLTALSQQVKLSQFHLQRLFKKLMGITPRQYADACRVASLKSALQRGATVTTALYEAGYSSSSRLYEKSAAQLGMTPAAYRKGGKGMQINYTVTSSSLGALLVAATTKGLCSVTLGDEVKSLIAKLHAEFPQASIVQADDGLRMYVNALLAYLNGQLPHPDLPLDVQGTAFQQRVWEELRRIPYGTTISYSQLAQRLGQPTATRAVARACATNPVALVNPCHRVVREGGALSGYRWGLERKAALLASEKDEG